MTKQKAASGSALLMALIFMAIFGALAVGYLSATSADLEASKRYLQSRRAHLAAETGLNLVQNLLPDISVQDTETADETLQALADGLNDQFQDNIFAGQPAGVSGNSLQLPIITFNFPEGVAQLDLQIYASSDDQYRVWSLGTSGNCRQRLMLDFLAQRDMSLLANFGVASRSRVKMTGNTSIEGANDSAEGSVLSTTQTHTTAIDMVGNIDISGDVSITNPAGNVRLIGNSDIGGEIKIGVDEPAFPELDVTPFESYATNIVDSSTSTTGNKYFENIRIEADTNPTFSGNVTIRGVVYIESPNRVTFTGNLNLIGTVVAEEPDGALDLNNHYVRFTGNTSTNGVEALPAGAQFDGLRDLTGSFILVPGYELTFTGNFSTINGSIAASQMKFTGNAGGTIKGSLLNYHDTEFMMSGNSNITIDHSQLGDPPAGMIFPRKLEYLSGSYGE